MWHLASLRLAGLIGLALLSGCGPTQPAAAPTSTDARPNAVASVAVPAVLALMTAVPHAEAVARPDESALEAKRAADKLTIHVLDVGQGDSTVVVGPEENGSSKVLIIDGVPSGSGTKLKQFFVDNHLDHVDYAVLTHYNADHVRGSGGLDCHDGLAGLNGARQQTCSWFETLEGVS